MKRTALLAPTLQLRRGLTLVELLAALIVLSAASASGIRILRHSTSAATDAQLQLAAIKVYEQWREHQLRSPDASLPWSWFDDQGNTWTVAASEPRPAGTLAAPSPSSAQQPSQIEPSASMQWRRITIRLNEGMTAGHKVSIEFDRLELLAASGQPGATP